MAKAKKNNVLSLEEKLEQALVPVEEQTYEVPDNWCWTRFGDIAVFIGGGTPSKAKSDYWNGEIPWASIKDVKGDYLYETVDTITKCGLENSSANMCEIGELILATRIEPGKTIISNIKTAINQDLKIVKTKLPVKYVHYYLKSQKNEFIEKSSGSTVLGITLDNVKEIKIPMPPLAEQQRIVEQIESLFAKLDEAKVKLEDSIDGIELRKAAIFHKAFTGRLTEKWCRTNGMESSSWEQKVFKNILDVRDGTHDSPQYYDEGYPIITSKNLKNGTITDKDIKYISKEDYEQINLRSKVDIGDVLFAMIGTIGNPVVVTDEPNYVIKNMALFKNIGQLNPFFLKYYLESKVVKDKMQKEAKGSTQKFVSLGYLRDFPICVPNADEQAEIVRILDVMLKQECDVEMALQSTLKQIEIMKKSILAKAFRGELGTNNPEEESSIELLKQILSEE